MKQAFYLLLTCSLIFTACADPCETMICYHDGICVEGTCDCPEGFTGDSCEVETPNCATLTGTTWKVDSYHEWIQFEEYVSAFNYNWEFGHNDSVSIVSDYPYETTMLGEGTYAYTLIGEDSINIAGAVYRYAFEASHLQIIEAPGDTTLIYSLLCTE